MRIAVYADGSIAHGMVRMALAPETWSIERIDHFDDVPGWDVAADLIILHDGALSADRHAIVQAVKQWRTTGFALPIIVYAEDTNGVDVLLNAGADDVIRGHTDFAEFRARVRAVYRRSQGQAHNTVEFGGMVFDLQTHHLTIDGVKIPLTGHETRVLEALVMAKGHTLSKGALWDHLYPSGDGAEVKIVDVLICKIRSKIQQAGGDRNHLATVWGRGYVIVDTPDDQSTSGNTGLTDAVLAALSSEDEMLTIAELYERVGPFDRQALSGAVSRLVRQGNLEVVTRIPSATYKITHIGKLKLHGEAA